MAVELRIGGKEREVVLVRVYNYQFPEAADNDPDDWLLAQRLRFKQGLTL